jgi:hypothetical protein
MCHIAFHMTSPSPVQVPDDHHQIITFSTITFPQCRFEAEMNFSTELLHIASSGPDLVDREHRTTLISGLLMGSDAVARSMHDKVQEVIHF